MMSTVINFSDPSVEIIQQGGVCKFEGQNAIGVVEINRIKNEPVASLAVWPTDRPQENRNDYLSRFTVKTGNLIPVGNQLFQVLAIVDHENKSLFNEDRRFDNLKHGALVIDSQPAVPAEFQLHAGSFYIGFNQTSELHGVEMEFSALKLKSNNGVEALLAVIEMWPNDLQKSDAKDEGLVKKVEVDINDGLKIGEKTYRILSIVAADKNAVGWIEIEIEK